MNTLFLNNTSLSTTTVMGPSRLMGSPFFLLLPMIVLFIIGSVLQKNAGKEKKAMGKTLSVFAWISGILAVFFSIASGAITSSIIQRSFWGSKTSQNGIFAFILEIVGIVAFSVIEKILLNKSIKNPTDSDKLYIYSKASGLAKLICIMLVLSEILAIFIGPMFIVY